MRKCGSVNVRYFFMHGNFKIFMLFSRKGFAFKLVGLGGTFDHLHSGHHELLRTAFRLGEKVAIALTTDRLHQTKEFREHLQSYEVREKNLRVFIESNLQIATSEYSIIPLNDPFGPAISEPALEAHVSSMETYPIAMKINEIRQSKGLSLLTLIVIPLVLGNEGIKISSSSIRAGLK